MVFHRFLMVFGPKIIKNHNSAQKSGNFNKTREILSVKAETQADLSDENHRKSSKNDENHRKLGPKIIKNHNSAQKSGIF